MTIRLLQEEARALLALERGRSPNFGAALQAWRGELSALRQRTERLGGPASRRLLAAEGACRRAGLAFAPFTVGDACRVPWRLPERLAQTSTTPLPTHPLLDAEERCDAGARDQSRGPLEAIGALLDGAASAAHWRKWPTTDCSTAPPGGNRIAVCLHLFYPELWPEIRVQLRLLPEPWDLIVTVPAFARTHWLAVIAADCPQVRFAPMHNQGRDVLPWLRLLSDGAFERYDWVCKLHTKKSPHIDHGDGDGWRQFGIAALIGSADNARAILKTLRADATAGMLGASRLAVEPVADRGRRQNSRRLAWLTRRLGPGAEPDAAHPFFAGTMFWFRPAALQRLAALRLRDDDFEQEMAQTDGTLAHAIERFVPTAIAAAGYRTLAWDDGSRSGHELLAATRSNLPGRQAATASAARPT